MSNDAGAIADLFATASLGGPEKAVGFVMWRVLHRYIREADRALVEFNLTHLQFQTLAMAAWLARTCEPVTQTQLARAADVAPMQISHMLKALERKGWVRRVRSTSDVRANNVEVTTAGLAVLRRALPAMIAVQRDVFGDDGAPGGSLLTALLRIELITPSTAEPHRRAHAVTAPRDSQRSPRRRRPSPARRRRPAR